MNNDLQLQIIEYEKIDDFFEKVHFVEGIITQYTSDNSSPGYMYWKQVLEYLYDVGFTYY